ncbi:GNAT family N-acetyltransferase [Streptomyces sp. SID3343]|uniref:GNAT family N-acetyltransferase n=1 Tax=Streptomyces sp. SID3343 TaxID=2690260 RepID=UPI00136B509F|nr:GNAT family N-acetyltransferase [Streptomyces sp. SID3343]MYW00084.1 GNAT family N-acetyltransferase [Streptomyces sp. SID3343]
MIDDIPPVVPAGRMSRTAQPVFALASGVELRPWHEGDAQVLADSCLDPRIRQWNRPGLLSPADARARISRWGHRWRREEGAVWAIAEPGGGRPVGLIGLGDLDLRGGGAEFLYWLLPAGRGRGVMVDATVRIGRWALEDLGLYRLRITHSVANPASCRVAGKAGFPLEGTMRGALLHADGWHDEHLHARIRGDAWPAGR